MLPKKRYHIGWYVLADGLASCLAWGLFYFWRRLLLAESETFFPQQLDRSFWLGIFLIPAGWIILFHLFGFYKNLYNKSRLQEFFSTFLSTLIGTVIIFFLVLLDDSIYNRLDYYKEFGLLLALQFAFVWTGRMFLLNLVKKQFLQGEVCINTLVIGSGPNAVQMFREVREARESLGYSFVGFLYPHEKAKNGLSSYLTPLGHLKDLKQVIENYKVDRKSVV